MKKKKNNIEDLINNMDWDPNSIAKKEKLNKSLPNPEDIRNHYNKLEKDNEDIFNDKIYLEHQDEIYKLSVSSLRDLCNYVEIRKIQMDDNLSFSQKKSLIKEIAPNESDYQVIGLNGSTMLHKIVLPQLIKFWTDANKIVGDPEDFENLSPEDMQQLIDNIDEMMDGEING